VQAEETERVLGLLSESLAAPARQVDQQERVAQREAFFESRQNRDEPVTVKTADGSVSIPRRSK
jgi:hypothetical protein